MKFQELGSDQIYSGHVLGFYLERVRYPDGHDATLAVVHHNGSVTIVPVDGDGRIWLVRQYRHPARQELLELPAGTLEDGELPEECALRELREEVGKAAGKLEKIGAFYLAPGYSTEFMHVYLARELSDDPLPGDDDEYLTVECHPIEAVMEMLFDGRIIDVKTVAALCLARPRLASFLEMES